MREWWREWYNCYAVVSLILACGYGAYHAICWSKLGPSDWGTWTGSLFTALAFCGTIYLATKSERDRAQEKLDTAVVFAASMLERVGWAVYILEQLERRLSLELVEAAGGDILEYQAKKFLALVAEMSDALNDCPEFGIDELKAVTVLPNRAAAHVSAAMQRVAVMKVDLRTISKANLRPGLSVTVFIQRQREAIAACSISLKRARREFKAVITDVNNDLEFHAAEQTKFDG